MTDAELRSVLQGHPAWMTPPAPGASLDDADLRQLVGLYRGIVTAGAGTSGGMRSLLAFWLGGASSTPAAPPGGGGGWWWRTHVGNRRL